MHPIPKTAFIFAAGYGKRLIPLTLQTPKPLIDLGNGQNCLSRHIHFLRTIGVKKIFVNAYHLSEQIIDFLKDEQDCHVIVETELYDTGGGIINALPALQDETLLMLNGDVWIDDLHALGEDVYQMAQIQKQGVLLLCPLEKAIGYTGKGDFFMHSLSLSPPDISPITHRGQAPQAPYVFTGVQLWKRAFLETYRPLVSCFSMRHYYDKAQHHGALFGYGLNSRWCDIGTHDTLDLLKNHLYC